MISNTVHRGAFCFFSGGFITAIVVNLLESKLAKRTHLCAVLWSEGHIASCSVGHFWGFHRVSEASLGVNDPPENISNH